MQAFAPDSCFGGPGKGETRLFKRYSERAYKEAGGVTAPGAVKSEVEPLVRSSLRCTWLYDKPEITSNLGPIIVPPQPKSKVAQRLTAPGASKGGEDHVMFTYRCTWQHETVDMAFATGGASREDQEVAEQQRLEKDLTLSKSTREQKLDDEYGGKVHLDSLQKGVWGCRPLSLSNTQCRLYYKHGRELRIPLASLGLQSNFDTQKQHKCKTFCGSHYRVAEHIPPGVTRAYMEKRALWKLRCKKERRFWTQLHLSQKSLRTHRLLGK